MIAIVVYKRSKSNPLLMLKILSITSQKHPKSNPSFQFHCGLNRLLNVDSAQTMLAHDVTGGRLAGFHKGMRLSAHEFGSS